MKNKKIPKTIHYCWFGGNPLPDLTKKCIESWKKMCPDYEIIEWNESNFDIEINDYVKEAYLEKKYAFVSDYARLYIIYNYGGIYLDTDVELIKNLDSFLDCDGFFSSEDNKVVSTGLGFGACKKNSIVELMMKDYDNTHFKLENGNLDLQPCPIKNSNSINMILKQFDDRTKICEHKNNYFYPKEYFCPMDNMTEEINITKNTVSIHHFSGFWLSEKDIKVNKNRRKICKIFGKKIGKKIVWVYTLPYRINKKIKRIGIKNTILFALNKFIKKG